MLSLLLLYILLVGGAIIQEVTSSFIDDVISCYFADIIFKMDSHEKKWVSERSQAYILRKQGYNIEEIMKILGKSNKFVMKWSKRGESGEFLRKRESGRPTKLSSNIIKTLENSKNCRGKSARKLNKRLQLKDVSVSKSQFTDI